MLEQLFSLVKNESENEIINNPAIPNEHNNHAVGLATDSIFGGLQNALGNGGLKNVLGMFAGGESGGSSITDNPVVGGMINNYGGNLMKKFGIDGTAASSIANTVIPKVLGKLVHKTNDPSDSSFDINGIIGSLTGAAAQAGGGVTLPGTTAHASGSGGIDFGNIVKSMAGGQLDANKDGHLGLDDLSGVVSGLVGNKTKTQGESGGGVMDLLKGFIGG